MGLVTLGSVTDLQFGHEGCVALVGSHGAAATGRYALGHGVGGLICHDAGIGADEAGIGALQIFESVQRPAAAVAHMSARIGDADDMLANGVLSRTNPTGTALGVRAGIGAREAAGLFSTFQVSGAPANGPSADFGRYSLMNAAPTSRFGGVCVVALDSASLIGDEDDGAIVITGSHGGLPSNSSGRALKANPVVAVFNDAGLGKEDAGVARLPVLQQQGVPGVCVDANSARIGDARSTYETGVISVVNEMAVSIGARKGKPLKNWIAELTEAAP